MTDDGILDLKALQVWLSERGLARGSIQARRIGDGHSNFTYAVEDRERTVVVRCPPPPPTPPGANDVLREARLLQALAPTPVPVPAVLAVGQAGEAMDVPFYVMDIGALQWYEAFALWKLAVLFEYGRRRHLAGAGDPYYADPVRVDGLLAAARRAMRVITDQSRGVADERHRRTHRC
jgi:hypothetical protein